MQQTLIEPFPEVIIDRDLDDRRNYELVHSIACELDLRTQSSENQIRVTKPYNTRSVILMNAQRISLDRQQNNLIADYLQEYPIDLVAADKHLRTDLDGKHLFQANAIYTVV